MQLPLRRAGAASVSIGRLIVLTVAAAVLVAAAILPAIGIVGVAARDASDTFTNLQVGSLGDPPSRQGFADEDDRLFKTPSLLYVGGTPPYYHDGHAATLEELVEKNHDRMGHTDHLKPAERAALVAFLRTL